MEDASVKNPTGWEPSEVPRAKDASVKKPHLVDNIGLGDLDSEDESKRGAARQRLQDVMEKAPKGKQ